MRMKAVWQIIRTGLGCDELNLSFDLDGEFVCRIVECPGRWLNAAELHGLLGQLRSVSAGTEAGEQLTYGVFSDDPRALDNRVITMIYDRESGRVAGFTALCILDLESGRRVVHLGLAMVHPAFRGRGLTRSLYMIPWLLMVLRNRGHAMWVSNVTQVPAMFGMVGEACEDVYPTPAAKTGPGPAHRAVAEAIMRNHCGAFGVGMDAGFDRDRFVITNAYTGGSDGLKKAYAATTKHRNQRYNDMCLRELDYERGDDFLQIGRCSARSLLRYLLRPLTPTGNALRLRAAVARAVLRLTRTSRLRKAQ